MQNKAIIIGGDKRFEYLKQLLSQDFSILPMLKFDSSLHTENIGEANIIILPYPYTFDHIHINAPNITNPILIAQVIEAVQPNQLVFSGGNVLEANSNQSKQIINYAENENLLLKNAILTAEGILKIAIEEMPISIFNGHFAITGFGRVGKATAKIFKNLGAKVTVFARKEYDRMLAEKEGYLAHNYNEFIQHGKSFDCVINTVPVEVITSNELASLNQSCLLIDVASSPYGIDFSSADKFNLKTIIAGSLPGKTSPITAAEIIYETIGEQL